MISKNWIPAKEAAKKIGISYSLLMSRIYSEKIPPKNVRRHGYAVFIKKSFVESAAKQESKGRVNANSKGMEGASR